MASTPPLAPVLLYPLNAAVSGESGVTLEWRYNSQYDNTASRYDYRYRIDGGNWVAKTTEGEAVGITESIEYQCQVEWQALAYGQLGDAGPWSNIGAFSVIGVPPKPMNVTVSNANRPVITFSAGQILSWEIEISDAEGNIIYVTGDVAFDGSYRHIVNALLENGDYAVKMRVRNEYGLFSDWASQEFTISVEGLPPLEIKVFDNNRYTVNLEIRSSIQDITGYNLEIYRAQISDSIYSTLTSFMLKNVHIAEHAGVAVIRYEDYTAAPCVDYKYMARLAHNEGIGYTDSNEARGRLGFRDCTIMEAGRPDSMVSLEFMPENAAAKTMQIVAERTFTPLLGFKSPVLEFGEKVNYTYAFTFLCDSMQQRAVEKLYLAAKPLILRDWRWGAVFGGFSGGIKFVPAGPDHTICSLNFTAAEQGGTVHD
jgi:hypothetical protein